METVAKPRINEFCLRELRSATTQIVELRWEQPGG